ncbi:unannotated protein [freshwater metagenome]|uniref:Unannotated protein n=1 Tax=freshwater metagenome TaxID=449393 RepID=A0A6J7BUT8_9ZZZZ
MTFATSVRLGTSYITDNKTLSIIALSPRAPVPRLRASSEMASKDSGVNSSSTSSRSKSFAYCLTRAFFGSVRISISAGLSSFSTLVTIGRRPMNSGIIPNLSKSSGMTSAKISTFSRSSVDCKVALKPTPAEPLRPSIIFSRPANAPPTMNSTFVVSI